MKEHRAKTNAVRLLDTAGIPYELRWYDVDENDLGATHVALQIGLPAARVFKTLVARGDRTGIVLACVPADAELDPKALAQASGNKKTELVAVKEITPLTGYVRGGVSPIGLRKPYPVYLDATAAGFPTISVSAGTRGCQVLLAPNDLAALTHATAAHLTRKP